MKSSNKTLYAFYDLGTCPPSFDVINFVCIASAVTKIKKYKNFHLVILHGAFQGFRGKTSHSISELRERMNSIILQACNVVDNCIGQSYIFDRSDAFNIMSKLDPDCIYPRQYNVKYPYGYYNWGATNEISKNFKVDVQNLKSNTHQLGECQKWLHSKDIKVKSFITVTLRQSDYQKERNSNISEWIKFANYLKEINIQTIFVKDSEKIFEENDLIEKNKFLSCEPASFDLAFRMALYELSKLSFVINNGPYLLAFLNPKVNFIIMKMNTENYYVSSEKLLTEWGFEKNKNLEFMKKNQKIIWQDDNFENILRGYKDIIKSIN